MKLNARGFSRRNFPGIIVNPILTFCFSLRVSFSQWPSLWSTQLTSRLPTPLRQQRGIHSDIYRWSVFRLWGFRKKNICLFIAIYLLFVWSAVFVNWCSAIGILQGVATAGSRFCLIWCTHQHFQSLRTRHRDTEIVHGWPRSGRPRVTSHERGI